MVPEGYERVAKLFQSNEKENEYFEWVWKYFEDNKTDIDSFFCSCCRDCDSISYKIPYHDRSLRARCSGLLFLKRMHSKYDIDFSYKDEHGHSAFSNAAIGGNLDIVRWLVEKCGVNPKKHARGRDNALVLATHSGKLDVIRCLIEEYGFDVNSKATKGNTPLLSVSDYTEIELIQYLVEHGADVNAKNNEGDTPLLNACRNKWTIKTVQYLIEHGADVNAKNNHGDIPLFNSISVGAIEFQTVQYLIEHGADVNAKNDEGYSVLYLVTWNDKYNEESLEWLINAGADCLGLGGQPEQILLKAAFFGKLSIIKSLVRDHGIDPNYHEEGGDYAIHVAASEINSRVVKWFIEEAGVDINARGERGKTPLISTIEDLYFGSMEMMILFNDALRFSICIHEMFATDHPEFGAKLNSILESYISELGLVYTEHLVKGSNPLSIGSPDTKDNLIIVSKDRVLESDEKWILSETRTVREGEIEILRKYLILRVILFGGM